MKITITQVVLEIEFPEQEEPAPVPAPNPFDVLLKRLLLEAAQGCNPKQWEVDPHGTVFKV